VKFSNILKKKINNKVVKYLTVLKLPKLICIINNCYFYCSRNPCHRRRKQWHRHILYVSQILSLKIQVVLTQRY